MENFIIKGLGLWIISMIGTIILLSIGYTTNKEVNEPLALLICCDIIFGLTTLLLFLKSRKH